MPLQPHTSITTLYSAKRLCTRWRSVEGILRRRPAARRAGQTCSRVRRSGCTARVESLLNTADADSQHPALPAVRVWSEESLSPSAYLPSMISRRFSTPRPTRCVCVKWGESITTYPQWSAVCAWWCLRLCSSRYTRIGPRRVSSHRWWSSCRRPAWVVMEPALSSIHPPEVNGR